VERPAGSRIREGRDEVTLVERLEPLAVLLGRGRAPRGRLAGTRRRKQLATVRIVRRAAALGESVRAGALRVVVVRGQRRIVQADLVPITARPRRVRRLLLRGEVRVIVGAEILS
jgi:hypothetical protein